MNQNVIWSVKKSFERFYLDISLHYILLSKILFNNTFIVTELTSVHHITEVILKGQASSKRDLTPVLENIQNFKEIITDPKIDFYKLLLYYWKHWKSNVDAESINRITMN